MQVVEPVLAKQITPALRLSHMGENNPSSGSFDIASPRGNIGKRFAAEATAGVPQEDQQHRRGAGEISDGHTFVGPRVQGNLQHIRCALALTIEMIRVRGEENEG